MSQVIFVFGSNLAGRHGAGSAQHARLFWGAISGIGDGRTGESYAIPTKDTHLAKLPLSWIERYVQEFLKYSYVRNDLEFRIVAIGCGLAGYHPKEIAPMFASARSNCIMPMQFKRYLHQEIHSDGERGWSFEYWNCP